MPPATHLAKERHVAPAPSWRSPADAVGNMRRVVELDSQDQCAMDEPMMSELVELVRKFPAILAALELADQACAALENTTLHPATRGATTPADLSARTKLANELRAHLNAIGA